MIVNSLMRSPDQRTSMICAPTGIPRGAAMTRLLATVASPCCACTEGTASPLLRIAPTTIAPQRIVPPPPGDSTENHAARASVTAAWLFSA
jgi:hypothetical protein